MKFIVFSITLFSAMLSSQSYLYPSFVDVYHNPSYYSNYINHRYVQGSKNSQLSFLQPLNILPEVPHRTSTDFTVVPLVVVTRENLRMLGRVEIVEVSKINPTMRVKALGSLLECTPAANVTLNKPLTVYSLRTDILFPREIEISDGHSRIPITVGAVVVPVAGDTFVSPDTPIHVRTVFAVPTRPFEILSHKDKNDEESVVVDGAGVPQAHNVTLLSFPSEEAVPVFEVDEEDDELVNRNPPIVLAPAGIVQSTQPFVSVQPFTNSKESSILAVLKEEAFKQKY